VVHDLSGASPAMMGVESECNWGPQMVRHIFTFKETLERVEEK